MVEAAVSWTAADAAGALTGPTAADDKYSRGVVGIRTGSDRYPGAAVLGVEAAWRTGTGMVRYLGDLRPTELVLARRPETVTADGRVQAWVVGSGTDAASRPPQQTAALRHVLAGAVPVVVDAGALDLVDQAGAPCVLTPHAREHAALRARLGLPGDQPDDDAGRAASARQTAATLGATVLLKGSVTIVATPSGWTARVDAATPWLATAGTGDVLAGVLGALVASAQAQAQADGAGLDAEALGALAATAAWVHGQAGLRAARRRGGDAPGPLTALDVADAVPPVIAALLASHSAPTSAPARSGG
ncbi:ADP-dependent NAD(P)H-hydrate dehydratase [Microbacterium elymi]|uniref:ADP-dependent (S)-NAD(P)H-hydrate dehydratase n=1 Tax=Microbacterium elymi TaxID=2909587 RepID=A0ABY5NKJ4_9MICO|nr:ADP/ATP-dependent (S)-NAD(P)H-hydrate dehydratase [Microbacterium elymi]UUT35685.1 NAD(P)H-hydrate dehydratase [Microbacterium elymi]